MSTTEKKKWTKERLRNILFWCWLFGAIVIVLAVVIWGAGYLIFNYWIAMIIFFVLVFYFGIKFLIKAQQRKKTVRASPRSLNC